MHIILRLSYFMIISCSRTLSMDREVTYHIMFTIDNTQNEMTVPRFFLFNPWWPSDDIWRHWGHRIIWLPQFKWSNPNGYRGIEHAPNCKNRQINASRVRKYWYLLYLIPPAYPYRWNRQLCIHNWRSYISTPGRLYWHLFCLMVRWECWFLWGVLLYL